MCARAPGMRVSLLHADRDGPPGADLLPRAAELAEDLALETLLTTMADGDPLLHEVARAALLAGLATDADTICYRQEILRDGIASPELFRELYTLAGDAVEIERRHYWRFSSHFPRGILSESVNVLDRLAPVLERLRQIAARETGRVSSRGLGAFFTRLAQELDAEYMTVMRRRLRELRFEDGLLASAGLGPRNEGTAYTLRPLREAAPLWLRWVRSLAGGAAPGYTIRIPERDQAGATALSELKDRTVDPVAKVVAEAADHVTGFFEELRREIGFYVAALTLHARLAALGVPLCFPDPAAPGARALHGRQLTDPGLALRTGRRTVGSDVEADGANVVIVTGANQGGKSSFLRSLGLAQLMMQTGLFVAAEAFTASRTPALFTHFPREEDATLRQGKLDEELARLSRIVDDLEPDALLLCNESFAATNEREGAALAGEVVTALLARRVRVCCVTHLYTFARGLYEAGRPDARFLRAERLADGSRTFRIVPGEPLRTSFGVDLYREIFESPARAPRRPP